MAFIGLSSCRQAVVALQETLLPKEQREFEGIAWSLRGVDFFTHGGKWIDGFEAMGRSLGGELRYKVRAGHSGEDYRLDAFAKRGWRWHGVSLESDPRRTLLHKWRESASLYESALVSLVATDVKQIRLGVKRMEIATTDLRQITREDEYLDWRGKEVARALAVTFEQPPEIVTGARILLPRRLEPNGHYLKEPKSALQLLGGLAVSPLNCAGPASDQRLLSFSSLSLNPSSISGEANSSEFADRPEI